MKTDVINLTRDLLRIPSPSGNEKRMGEFLVKRLKRSCKVKLQKVGNRFNIIATKGKPKLLLTTHIDTVPKELPLKEDKEWICGRGAGDTKGIIAAMICAVEEAIALGRKDFGLLFDVSEETDFSGIKKAINLVNPEVVIVGEPTKNKIVYGQKGLLGIKVKCKGKSAPGATPEQGTSAINKLLIILEKIKGKQLPTDQKLGSTTLNIGQIKGGVAPNVVADYAEAIIEVRTTCSNEKIRKLLLKNIPKRNIRILYNFESSINADEKFLANFKCKKEIAPYFTEMYFWAKKAKTIVFGPGDYKYAHTNLERIRKSDLIKGKQAYLNIIKLITNKLHTEQL